LIKENEFEIDRHSFDTYLPIEDNGCYKTEEINVTKEKLATPKCKINISCTRDLFTPENRIKSISVCNTPEADLKALPKNSKNVYPLKVRSFNDGNKMKKIMCYKKCNFVEGIISLLDKEFKHIVDNSMEKK